MPSHISVTLSKDGKSRDFESMKLAEYFICPKMGENNKGSLLAYYMKIGRPLRGFKITKQQSNDND